MLLRDWEMEKCLPEVLLKLDKKLRIANVVTLRLHLHLRWNRIRSINANHERVERERRAMMSINPPKRQTRNAKQLLSGNMNMKLPKTFSRPGSSRFRKKHFNYDHIKSTQKRRRRNPTDAFKMLSFIIVASRVASLGRENQNLREQGTATKTVCHFVRC